MKKFLSIFTLFACMLAIVGCTKDEENKTGTIAGIVSDYANANKPIAGVTVTLNTKGISKTTGSDGRYEFTDVEPGAYTLQAKADNYQATTKQVTVTAGQTANCDFQLEPATRDISIEPKNVIIGGSMYSKEITIINNLNKEISFTLSNLPDFITTDTPNGTISAKGRIDVILEAVNRQSITSQRTGQFSVQVGNDSYVVTVTVEPYQTEQVNVEIIPTSITFDKKTEQATFTIKNNNTFQHDYSITSNLDILTVSPVIGTIPAGSTHTITVIVNNRKAVTTDRTGNLTIDLSGSTRTVFINVQKYDEEEQATIPVTRSLLAYYNFNDGSAKNAYLNDNYGVLQGTPQFIPDTPTGKGKALFLASQQYINIANSMLSSKKAFTVGMWLKDFGTGPLFVTIGSWRNTPSLYVTNESKLNITYYSDHQKDFKTSLASYQSSGWHHIVVTANNGESLVLYVDGIRIDSEDVGEVLAGGNKMQIGGNGDGKVNGWSWADPMKIDNVRIHSVALSDNEVMQIYNSEKNN